MPVHGEVRVNIPAADLMRARRFYVDMLGLTPAAEDEQGVRFATPPGSWFEVYETPYAGSGKHTVAQWDVEDLSAAVAQLGDVGSELRALRHARRHVGRRHPRGARAARRVVHRPGQRHVPQRATTRLTYRVVGRPRTGPGRFRRVLTGPAAVPVPARAASWRPIPTLDVSPCSRPVERKDCSCLCR
jgi:catechol 2,3-dioxygenase-like lactoylglutathione lyase family enzyme